MSDFITVDQIYDALWGAPDATGFARIYEEAKTQRDWLAEVDMFLKRYPGNSPIQVVWLCMCSGDIEVHRLMAKYCPSQIKTIYNTIQTMIDLGLPENRYKFDLSMDGFKKMIERTAEARNELTQYVSIVS